MYLVRGGSGGKDTLCLEMKEAVFITTRGAQPLCSKRQMQA